MIQTCYITPEGVGPPPQTFMVTLEPGLIDADNTLTVTGPWGPEAGMKIFIGREGGTKWEAVLPAGQVVMSPAGLQPVLEGTSILAVQLISRDPTQPVCLFKLFGSEADIAWWYWFMQWRNDLAKWWNDFIKGLQGGGCSGCGK